MAVDEKITQFVNVNQLVKDNPAKIQILVVGKIVQGESEFSGVGRSFDLYDHIIKTPEPRLENLVKEAIRVVKERVVSNTAVSEILGIPTREIIRPNYFFERHKLKV